MPAPENTAKYQQAVLWNKSGVGRYAETTVGDPEEVTVRWKWTRRDVKDAQGNRVSIDAQVEVGQEVAIGSLMWLGTLDDWDATGSAATETGMMEVVVFDRTPDIKGRFYEMTASLARYKNTLAERS